MSLAISDVVKVSVSIAPQAQFANGFAAAMLVSINHAIPTSQRIQTFTSLAQVAAFFGTACEEYYAAEVYFSQNPQPGTLLIGRRFEAATPGELLGSAAPVTLLSTYTAITTGSLKITIDGTVETVTGIDLHLAASLNAVAAAVQAAIAAVKTGSTCIWNGTQFMIRSGTTGVNSSVSLSTASGTGVDLGPLMGFTQAMGAVSTPGVALETVAQSLTNLLTTSAGWFYFAFTKEIATEVTVPNPDILAAAAWAEANAIYYGQSLLDGTAFLPTPAASTAATLAQLDYSYTATQYETVVQPNTDPYAIMALLARMVTVNFDLPNSTIDLKFKQEPGITPVVLTETQRLQLEANNVNYYTLFGLNAMIAEGVSVGGRWVDEVVGLAWLQWSIQTAIFAYLYSLTTKLPQTDKGVACITQVISNVLDRAVANGLLAPGQWNAGPITGMDGSVVVNTGDFVKKGYIVYAAPVASQSQTKRAQRIYDLFTIVAQGAGAIQQVNVALTFES